MKRSVQVLAAFAGFVVPALMVLAPSPGGATGAEAPPLVQSPPVFAPRGTAVPIEATPSGEPSAMSLLVGSRRTKLEREPSGAWHGEIAPGPSAVIRYRVDATYADGRVATGETGTLTYLDRITSPAVVTVPAAGTPLAKLRLGIDVGVVDGRQAARLLPPSFAVDEQQRTIDVLDAANARIARFNLNGRSVGTTPITTRSTTVDDIERSPDGALDVLDAARRQLIHIDATSQRVTEDAVAIGAPANLRLGRSVPRDLSVVLEGGSVLVGDLCRWRACVGTEGARITLDRAALDVSASAVDGHGVLWSLVDLDDGSMRLVSLDLAHPAVVAVRAIDASVFGDVTRRLVALGGGGAVVMSGDRSTITFTRYGVA